MEEKMNKYGITLDGNMNEPIWNTVEEHTGFRLLGTQGGKIAERQTFFKVLPCEDRVYVGVRCEEPDGMDKLEEIRYLHNAGHSPSIEVFLSPDGSDYEFYQFLATINGQRSSQYYSEGGNIRPDKYAPDWDFAVYIGDTYWSIELEFPLTAFYWTPHTRWSNTWRLNITRNHSTLGPTYTTWSPTHFGFLEPGKFRSMAGFPTRPVEDDVCIMTADAELTDQTTDGYTGTMTIKTNNAVAADFDFVSDRTETVSLSLNAGSNEFTVPCFFDKLGRNRSMLSLVRKSDGKVFKRYMPILSQFEPIKLALTKPEYRGNFYPGQDYTEVAGRVETMKSATVTLEGAGIEKMTITPDADGKFSFQTPGFEIGEAWLTVNSGEYELKKKLRRLAPTEHMMTWISGGNLVVNGKPTLRRDMYARYYRGGTAFERRYRADNLHETWLGAQTGGLEPRILMPKSEGAGGEATKDQMPSAEMLKLVDAMLEANKDRDFAYYYISDEPECRGVSPVYLKHLYEYVADKDPYHVVLSASRSAGSSLGFADWFETHPYICPYVHPDGKRIYLRPLHTLGSFVDSVSKLDRPDKCIGFLPTCYASGGGRGGYDHPTFDEYICHIWEAMMHGGKTLWPYAYHDLNDRASVYEGTRYIFSSFEALEDIVLFGKRTSLFRSTENDAVLYEHGDEKMFVLVNLTQEPKTVTLDGLTGTWHEFRGSRTFTGNTFQMRPLETIIGTNVVKGADLPTYAEVAKLIDEVEYKRTHTGSLLFGRDLDISVKSSGMRSTSIVKLFDGTPDNMAGFVNANPDNFIELDLTKVNPTFSKVVLRGFEIEDAELKFRVGEEWITPAVAEVANEEYAKIFNLAESVTPDGLRFEFGGKLVELYEIEVM